MRNTVPRVFIPGHVQGSARVGERSIDVDKQIISLVEVLNKIPDLTTVASCQCAEDGYAWISWDSDSGRERLFEIAGEIRKVLSAWVIDAELAMYWFSPTEHEAPIMQMRIFPEEVEAAARRIKNSLRHGHLRKLAR